MRFVTVPYGPPAQEALAATVAAAKSGDPLAPVTVVVSANSVGVAARRALGRGPAGVIGVQFLTIYRLAELLGGARLAAADRRPVSTPVLAAAVRRALARTPGIFAGVHDHAATEEALIAAHRLLSDCSRDGLAAIAARGRRANEVVRVHRALRADLGTEWFDEHDLIGAAVEAARSGSPLVDALGVTIMHLPQPLGGPAIELMRTIAAVQPVIVIVGSTGVERADADVFNTVARLTNEPPPDLAPTPPVATNVRSVSDADEEARAAVRDVVDALRAGVPIDRVAILYGAREPYARLLHEHCAAAGLVVNGSAVRTIADSMAGRFLVRMLALADRGFSRADVCAWLAGAPVRDAQRRVPANRWEALSRRAGVVGGADWQLRLGAYAASQRREADEEMRVPDREPQPERYQREAREADAFAAFVAKVQVALAPQSRTWSEHAQWAKRLLTDFLGREAVRARWPEWEQRGAGAIEAALDRLATLDAVEDRPSLAVFQRTLELELDSDLGRVGRQGVGVLVAPVTFGLGLDLDRLIVVGLAEGLFPPRRAGDALLPDDDRDAAGGEIRLVGDLVHDDHRALLAAIAAARGAVTLSWPRGDLRRTSELRPSRFVIDTIAALEGHRPSSGELERLRAPWFDLVPSFLAGFTRAPFPSSAQDHRLRSLAAGAVCDDTDGRHARAVQCMNERASRRFTRFDGNVTRIQHVVPGPRRDARPISATALQEWSKNPFEYFVSRVLGAEIPEVPEERFEISPLDRGSLVHTVLERWLIERLGEPESMPAPDEPWSDVARRRMQEITLDTFDEYHELGLTGRELFWQRDRLRILTDLLRFLDEDNARRADARTTPHAAELAFGLARQGSFPAVSMTLPDGTAVQLRGAADRVDIAADGTLHVVDYKTGKIDKAFRDIREADPDQHGTKLQLPVYALAARAATDRNDAPVCASYWFTSRQGGFEDVALPLTPGVYERVAAVVATIVGHIEGGVFPCRPGDDSWFRRRTHSDPDALGTRDLGRAWSRKCGDPILADYCELTGEADG